MSDFCFPFSICPITSTFPPTLRAFLLSVPVALLSRHQSAVNRSSRNVQGNFTHKVNYRHCSHFPGLEFMQLLERVEGLPSPGRGDGWILKTALFLGNYTGIGNWQCRYMQGRWSNVCRTKRGSKARALWGNCWYHRMRNATNVMSQKTKSLYPSSTVYIWSLLYLTAKGFHFLPAILSHWRSPQLSAHMRRGIAVGRQKRHWSDKIRNLYTCYWYKNGGGAVG
jgi:hypothetical protein